MRIAEILTEYSPKRTEFSRILTDSTLKMGFECEVLLPESSSDDHDYAYDSDYYHEQINEMSWSEVEEHASRRTRDRINERFLDYIDQKLAEKWDEESDEIVKIYCEDNNLLNPDDPDKNSEVLEDQDNIDAAREEWEEDARSDIMDQYDMDDFINENYNDMAHFASAFDIDVDIEPPERESMSVDEIHDNAAGSLSDALGARVYVGRGGSKNWHVKEDGSIDGDGTGMEIISPVFGMMDGLQALKTVFDWIKNNAGTNRSTGLHVSFSIDGKTENDYDYLKMIVLYDENYTADLFKRFNNTYAKQMRTVLFRGLNNATDVERMPEREMLAVVEKLRKLSPSVYNISEKYFSFRHRANGVFEFRTMGNAYYETRYEDIRKRIIAMASIMKVGCYPTLRTREYLSRVYRMLTSEKFSDPALSSGSSREPLQIPWMLSSFAPIFTRHAKLAMLANKEPIGFLLGLARMLISTEQPLSARQIRQLRLYSKKHNVTPEVGNFGYDAYNLLANYLGWPIIVQGDERQVTLPFAKAGEPIRNAPEYDYDAPRPRIPMTD